MNIETFFENFAHFADAPNGVKKLRELILQLAVRGKLVPRDPNDEPAAKLLERILAEKCRLVKEKKIRNSKPLPSLDAEEIPMEIPKTWIFTSYLVRARSSRKLIYTKYVYYGLESSFVRSQIEGPIRSTSGVKNINSSEINNLIIPLPPLPEQHRIVAKVDQLMALCDELESRLTKSQTKAEKLTSATVHGLMAA